MVTVLQSMEIPICWLDANDHNAHRNDRRYQKGAVKEEVGVTVSFGSSSAWSLRVDGKHGQAGWVGNYSNYSDNSIMFNLSLVRPARLSLGYLSTFENIGAALCWINKERAAAKQIDGLTMSHTSFIRNYVFGSVLPAGQHTLSCLPVGPGRFKITSISAFAGSTLNVSANEMFNRIQRGIAEELTSVNATQSCHTRHEFEHRLPERCPLEEYGGPLTCTS